MTKRYELLKDLPNIDIGSICEQEEGGYYVFSRNDGCSLRLPYSYVENNSTWFKEVVHKELEFEKISVQFAQWILHRFIKTEYDGTVLKWKWNQTLWSSQDMFERFVEDEEIKPTPQDEGKFQWSEQVAKDFFKFLIEWFGRQRPDEENKVAGKWENILAEFKASKQLNTKEAFEFEHSAGDMYKELSSTRPQPQDKERIGVSEFEFLTDGHNGAGVYWFETMKQIHPDKFPAIIQAIKNILNS